MSRKSIVFDTDAVSSIIKGTKTAARFVVKPHNPVRAAGEDYRQGVGLWIDPTTDNPDKDGHIKDYSVSSCWSTFKWYIDKFAPYHIGDIVYIRETWTESHIIGPDKYFYREEFDLSEPPYSNWKWKSATRMPKEAARIFLRITDVRIERLQDITEDDAYREGVMKAHDQSFNTDYWYYKEGQNYPNGKCWTENARQCFLWGMWNGRLKKPKEYERYNQNRNPWVWVIEFKVDTINNSPAKEAG